MTPDHLFEHRCTIIRSSQAVSGGEVTKTPANLATDVPCLLQEGRGRTRNTETGEVMDYDGILFLAPDQDLRPNATNSEPDVILMTGHPVTSIVNGKYRVMKTGDESGQGILQEAYLSRLSPATTA